ncbi:Peptidyl-prolyl isomerase CWC27 [Emericellopsis cladophorae]|uniref:peptidylprolyl isomerase n=1 Tax=Emericellopsis cladophorae TaxID=2686198 RepID=A0A9P9Y1W4_9HYPO|nr:Peptidyl-prolyl isomerase CWC27 [Emericellopsis cladophorae]KAI6781801.1 Peptidyl-prolyl isomerase CWC27 [Emericellopsis cladophorae]
MSAIYNLEPQPTGKAIIHTTLGEITVELFAKQTPLACRNFLQLALDGYYDDTIFHRLVPGFILQGGDPTGTGNGGESIYDGGAFSGDLDPWPMDMRQGKNAGPQGINFKDEFHSRLKFNRRGLLGMANDGRPDTNGSQWFFTLDKAEELNGKNTLFGRVAQDGTIYNLAKIGESEVAEGTDRPMYPVKVQRVEIIVNPFEDMQKRSRVAVQAPSKPPVEKEKKKKRKGGKQLLSFGDEEGEEEMPVLKKPKFDTRLIAADETVDDVPAVKAKPKKRKVSPKRQLSGHEEEDEEAESIPKTTLKKKQVQIRDVSPEPELTPPPKKSAAEQADEEIAALKASMKRNVQTEDTVTHEKKSALDSLIPESSIKGGRKRRPGQTALEDPKTLQMLKAFQSRLEKLPESKEPDTVVNVNDGTEDVEAAAGDEEAELCDLHFIANCQSCRAWDKDIKEDSDDEGWMSHSLSFAADRLGKDLTNRRKAEEELVVIDPREKAKALKEDKRPRRDRGEGKQWDQRRDQAKNAKLAKAASLAGRGAK